MSLKKKVFVVDFSFFGMGIICKMGHEKVRDDIKNFKTTINLGDFFFKCMCELMKFKNLINLNYNFSNLKIVLF